MTTNILRLKNKMKEVYIIEPNDLGLKQLTNFYKKITVYFKTAPFIIIIPLSFIAGIMIYFIFGYLLIRLVSMLQYGF